MAKSRTRFWVMFHRLSSCLGGGVFAVCLIYLTQTPASWFHSVQVGLTKLVVGLTPLLAVLFPFSQDSVLSQTTITNTFGPVMTITGAFCEESLFCKHPCSAGTGGSVLNNCFELCQPGQAMGTVCQGSNGMTGSCVGVCASTIGTPSLTSCTQQPTDPANCAANDPCVGFVHNPLFATSNIVSSTGLCTWGCGWLSGMTMTTATQFSIQSVQTGALCATGTYLIPGSLFSGNGLISWSCGNPFDFTTITGNSVQCTSLTNFCGDGVIQPASEQCEQGVGGCAGGQSCTSTCQCSSVTTTLDCDLGVAGIQGPGSVCSSLPSGLINGSWSSSCVCQPFTCSIDIPSAIPVGHPVYAAITVYGGFPFGTTTPPYTITHQPAQGGSSGTMATAQMYIPLTYVLTGPATTYFTLQPTSQTAGLTCQDATLISQYGGTGSYQCIGAVPTHAVLCAQDNQGLTVDLPRTLVMQCSSPVGSYPKCEYICESGYIYANGQCVLRPTGSGKPSSVANYCGDKKKAGSEECDDGNLRNGDGCNKFCKLETPRSPYTGSTSPTVYGRFLETLRQSTLRLEKACQYTDTDYGSIIFEDIQWNPDEEAIRTLQAYCIVKGYTVTQNKQYHTEAATSIGEAIKILSKIHALGETIEFDEFARHNERLPYSDMLPNARYTTYVLYAHERGLLDGIGSRKVFGRGELKALTPISKKQVKQLLDNFGADPKQYPELDGSGRFVSRDLFASIVVDAFRDKMPDYRYLYGQNTLFYRWLIARLQSKPLAEHEAYVRQMIDGLKLRDVDMMGWKYNLDIDGIRMFLNTLL